MKTLFNISLSYVCNHLPQLREWSHHLPVECREHLLEWLVSHDRLALETPPSTLNSKAISPLMSTIAHFSRDITQISFFLSEQLDNQLLTLLAEGNSKLTRISLVYCNTVTDEGIVAITRDQPHLRELEIRGMHKLTGGGLQAIESEKLFHVDLSECVNVDSYSVVEMLKRNRSVRHLYLNNCKLIDDSALNAIALIVGRRLRALELDFLEPIKHNIESIMNLTRECPNLESLSLCRYFGREFDMLDTANQAMLNDMLCHLDGKSLKSLDLYANYFAVLPQLPSSIRTLRISCTGGENSDDIANRLLALPLLTSVKLVVFDEGDVDVNAFLCRILPRIGELVCELQVHTRQLTNVALRCIDIYCTSMRVLCLDTPSINNSKLCHFFTSNRPRARAMISVRLSCTRVSSRVLHVMCRLCHSLRELDLAHITNVDDRTLKNISVNCTELRSLNVNGCEWVGDIGLCSLARHCHRLQEVRCRGTRCTDRSLKTLAQYCPQLQWISYADQSQMPCFSPEALQNLRDSCDSRVIC